MKKIPAKPNLLVDLTKRKMEALKTGATSASFGKFKPHKSRNDNVSGVGPAWGPRKGN